MGFFKHFDVFDLFKSIIKEIEVSRSRLKLNEKVSYSKYYSSNYDKKGPINIFYSARIFL